MTFFFDVFLPYMTKMFSGIIDMMKDSRFTAVFGFNFFWIIVGFWILWQMVNIFLIRPNLHVDDLLLKSSKTTSSKTISSQTYVLMGSSRSAGSLPSQTTPSLARHNVREMQFNPESDSWEEK